MKRYQTEKVTSKRKETAYVSSLTPIQQRKSIFFKQKNRTETEPEISGGE